MASDEETPVRKDASKNKRILMNSVFGDNAVDSDSDDSEAAPRLPSRRQRPRDSDDDDDDDDSGSEGARRKPKTLGGGRLKKKAGSDSGSGSEDGGGGDGGRIPRRRSGGGGGASEARPQTDIGDIDDDDFIDDRGARHPRDNEDDDIIRTEGGMHVDDDIEARPGEEEDEEEPRKLSAYEEGIARSKRTKKTRRKETDPADIDAEVVDFLRKMMQAREDDIDAYENNKPAMNKLRMLPAVRHMFIKHEYREALLDRMVLAVLKCWLEPMSDSALPNIEIRTLLLEILGTFRVDSNWVERLENSSGLGKIVHYLSIKDEHPPNQLVAKKLLKNWARPFYNANDDFHDLRTDFEHNEGMADIRRDAQKSLAKLEAQNKKRRDILASEVGRSTKKEQIVALLPEKSPLLFTRMADSNSQQRVTKNRGVKRKAGGSASRPIAKRFNALKNKSKGRGNGSQKPSLNGR